MKIIFTKIYLLVVGVVIIAVLLVAQSVILRKIDRSDTKLLINKIFSDFESKEWRTRDAAVTELARDGTLLEKEQVKQQLIKVFQNEMEVERQRKKSFYLRGEQQESDDEGYGEYYIELLVIAGKLKNPDTIPFLVNSLEYGLGVAVSLAELGDIAAPQLIEKCRTGDRDEKRNCVDALFEFLKHNPSTGYRGEIEKTLSVATKDRDEGISRAAIEILRKIKSDM